MYNIILKNKADFASLDIFFLELREDFLAKFLRKGAGVLGVFGDGNGGVWVSKRGVAGLRESFPSASGESWDQKYQKKEGRDFFVHVVIIGFCVKLANDSSMGFALDF